MGMHAEYYYQPLSTHLDTQVLLKKKVKKKW